MLHQAAYYGLQQTKEFSQVAYSFMLRRVFLLLAQNNFLIQPTYSLASQVFNQKKIFGSQEENVVAGFFVFPW